MCVQIATSNYIILKQLLFTAVMLVTFKQIFPQYNRNLSAGNTCVTHCNFTVSAVQKFDMLSGIAFRAGVQ